MMLLLEVLVAGLLLLVEMGSILTLPIPVKLRLCAAHRIVILHGLIISKLVFNVNVLRSLTGILFGTAPFQLLRLVPRLERIMS